MAIQPLIGPIVMISLVGLIAALGMNATFDELISLFRQPVRLLKALIAVNVVAPVAAAIVIGLFPLTPLVRMGIIVMAVSPVPPFVPGKAFKAGGEKGYTLGGEQSGHIIELGFAPSGDGIASALLTLEALAGRDLATARVYDPLPQQLINVPVRGAATLVATAPAVRAAISLASGRLADSGRVLVRPSGTEPLVRVMAEAPSSEQANAVCEQIAAAVRAAA